MRWPLNPNSNSNLLESGLGKGISSGSTEELMATVEDLLLLAEVVEAGGIRATSARTGLTKSRLSRRIAALEERLHVCLLTRNSRHFEVTDIGRALYQHALQIREAARSAMTLATDTSSEPGGLLRVACPFALSRSVLTPLALAFAIRHPRVRLCLATTKGTAEALEQHYDLLIHPSSQQLPDSDVVARRLSTVPYVLVASPALFEGLEVPKQPAGLDRFPVVGSRCMKQPWPGWASPGCPCRFARMTSRGHACSKSHPAGRPRPCRSTSFTRHAAN